VNQSKIVQAVITKTSLSAGCLEDSSFRIREAFP